MDALETRLRKMGLSPARSQSQDKLAKSLRRLSNGAFGKMKPLGREARGDFRGDHPVN